MEIQSRPELAFDEQQHLYTLGGLVLPSVTQIMSPMSSMLYAAVPQAAHSSNVESSSTATGRSSTFIPISFANCRRLLLVIEGRIEVDFGVM